MSQLILTCDCGQSMIVPASALGRVGLCPDCGKEIQITEEAARPYAAPAPNRKFFHPAVAQPAETSNQDHASRSFAQSVDLYNQARYAEALTLLDALLQQFPGNHAIESARQQCLRALRESPRDRESGQRLTPELVHRVLRDKMLHGKTETTQLQAAEIAARILRLYPNGHDAGFPKSPPAIPPDEQLPDAPRKDQN